MPTDDQLITAAQLAERWGCSRAHVYNLVARGLPSVKLGRARRFSLYDCAAFVAAHREHAGAGTD